METTFSRPLPGLIRCTPRSERRPPEGARLVVRSPRFSLLQPHSRRDRLAGPYVRDHVPAAVHQMKLGVIAALITSAVAAQQAPRQPCTPVRVVVTPDRPGRAISTCFKPNANFTPYIYVDGDQLKIGDLSDHNETATMYGDGTVVKVHQAGRHLFVLAVTSRPRVTVRVRFGPWIPPSRQSNS